MKEVQEPEKGRNNREEIRSRGAMAMASGDPTQTGASAGKKREGPKDQEVTDNGNNNAGGKEDRDEGNKAVGGKDDGEGTPEGQGENNMNIGTGGFTSDHFNILMSLRLARPPDDSTTKVIRNFPILYWKQNPKHIVHHRCSGRRKRTHWRNRPRFQIEGV